MPASPTCVFMIPGDWLTPTGGYRYDRRLVLALRDAGWQVGLCTLDASFPWPSAAALDDAQQQLAALPDGTVVVADGLAFGAMPELAYRHASRLRWVALVHHPLHLETGLVDAARTTLWGRERLALQAAHQVVVTSAATARDVIDLDVPATRITVVEPGTDRVSVMAPFIASPATPSPETQRAARSPRLLCVATLTPRKGHVVLLRALSELLALDWTLHCVGSPLRDITTAGDLYRTTAELGLAGRVHWHGEVDDAALEAQYAAADLFVLPSWHEGYGMVVAEALAHGLPVVTTLGGALAQTLPAEAGLRVPPGDAGALRDALAQLIENTEARAHCAAGARAAGEELPTWARAAARFATVLEGIA